MSTNNNILIIGDVHCKIDEYHKIIQDNPGCLTVQLGDFGFAKEHNWHLDSLDSDQHKVLFGNHDDYNFLFREHSLGCYGIHKDISPDIMFTRGAQSIDKDQRMVGIDWFHEEELSYAYMSCCIEYYEERKPRIMITHDCPDTARQQIFGIKDSTRTSCGLDLMFQTHQPDLWIFGHHHRSKTQVINGTRFICLAELETLAI